MKNKSMDLERLIASYSYAQGEKNKARIAWFVEAPKSMAEAEERSYLAWKEEFNRAAHALAMYVLLHRDSIGES